MPPARRPHDDPPPAGDRYHGFSLRSVCWGYREIFREAIEGLFEQGAIGPDRQEVTRRFFDLMKRADQRCYDHVLKEFLAALRPQTRWVLDLPEVFTDVVDLAQELAGSRLHYGITLFRTLGAGGLGRTPAEIRELIAHVRRLKQTDEDLAVALIKGYARLAERLRGDEIGRYLDVGLRIYQTNKKKALAFLAGTLQTSETYILSITRECRLADVHGLLTALLRALTGREIEVGELGRLDADDLLERPAASVCLYRWLYLPERLRYFDDAALNRRWYLLMGVVAAAAHEADSFCRAHGLAGHRTLHDVAGHDPLELNLLSITEYVRVLRRIRGRWPGARRLIDFGLRQEFEWRPPATDAERLFRDAAADGDGSANEAVEAVRRAADAAVNFLDTADLLDEAVCEAALTHYPRLGAEVLRPSAFLPDFLFPATAAPAASDRVVADLRRAADRRRDERQRAETAEAARVEGAEEAGDGPKPEPPSKQAEPAKVCYVYDEWCREENDYYRDFCFVHEKAPAATAHRPVPGDVAEQARKVGRLFERLRPDLASREKYLPDGEDIDTDLLVDYLVQRRREPAPKVRFYRKPRINRRDLAVEILLDSSGSTGEELDRRTRIIDVEKHAALILAQGLATLGDRFAVCGFHSNGPENCAYLLFKDYPDPWGRDAADRVLSAHPVNCTRIGPALRHAGFRLRRLDARQRLILLITDGRPMDERYDPNTRHAQYDVRMACEENARQCVHTFGISTEANSLADMEIMFPRRRFAILPDIRQLPRVLPDLYVRLTL